MRRTTVRLVPVAPSLCECGFSVEAMCYRESKRGDSEECEHSVRTDRQTDRQERGAGSVTIAAWHPMGRKYEMNRNGRRRKDGTRQEIDLEEDDEMRIDMRCRYF